MREKANAGVTGCRSALERPTKKVPGAPGSSHRTPKETPRALVHARVAATQGRRRIEPFEGSWDALGVSQKSLCADCHTVIGMPEGTTTMKPKTPNTVSQRALGERSKSCCADCDTVIVISAKTRHKHENSPGTHRYTGLS